MVFVIKSLLIRYFYLFFRFNYQKGRIFLSKLIYKYFSPDGLKKSKNLTSSSRLVIKEAEKYGIKWKIIPGTQIVTLTYQGEEKSYYHQVPSSTTSLAKYACSNKKITSNLLQQAGISVPKGFRVKRDYDDKYLAEVFRFLKKPLVVKPSDGTWGENITVNISTYEKLLQAVDLALAYSSKKSTGAVVEEMFSGEEYRILVTRKKVIGALNRVPANVIGNDRDTIKKLIMLKNKEDIRRDIYSHSKIRLNERLKQYLSDQGLSLEKVLKHGQRVFLRRLSNISQGGDAIDFSDLIHPSVKRIALKAIRTIPGLSFAGVDFMSLDITKEQTKKSYVIIEINDSPGFDIHDYPYKGKNRHATREFLYLLFPELRLEVNA